MKTPWNETPFFSCCIEECARETSYPEDMLRVWHGKAICNECYDQEWSDGDPSWHDLPPFEPAYRKEINRLLRIEEAAQAVVGMLDDRPEVYARARHTHQIETLRIRLGQA